MLILQSLSKFPVSTKNCFSKSYLLHSFLAHGKLLVTRSIHSLTLEPCNMLLKPSSLLPNMVFTRSRKGIKRKLIDPPVKFLPFQWTRKAINDEIAMSGDRVRNLDIDMSLPIFGTDMTEYLKDLDDVARKQFLLESAAIKDIVEVYKERIVKKMQQHPVDFNSREVNIALGTVKILKLIHYRQLKPKDTRVKVMLIHAIHNRNKMLKHLRNVDMPRFEWVIKELNIEFTPPPLQVQKLHYTRKNELRRLTKEYCVNLIGEKRAAYHEELKKQQELFLKEKEEILAWIANEEKELEIAKDDNESSS